MSQRKILKQLPKASLISFERLPSPYRFYFSRFRLANAVRWQFGRVCIVHRAPWLEKSAHALYPHLFEDRP